MEAITRKEKIMSGENLTPITRKEMFLAKAAGQNVETPEPATREEMFLSKIGGGSGGATINNQDKTITENGVYQADEGYTGLGTVTVEVASTGGGDIDAILDGSISVLTSEARSIKYYKLYNCKALTEVNLPNVTIIEGAAFKDCTNLVTLNIPKVTRIGTSAFENCSNLVTLSINAGNYIEKNAFKTCSKLEFVRFKNLYSLGSEVFIGCPALKIADLGDVNDINSSAFHYCTALKAVVIRRTFRLCELTNTNAFTGTALMNSGEAYIYVPKNLIENYKAATNWSTFATQFRALEDYTVDGTITGELDESKI